jgi:hypothetical protein
MSLAVQSFLTVPDATTRWIAAAADDPQRRLTGALPADLDFRPWAALLRSLHASALPDTQLGAALLLGREGLDVGTELTWRARYPAVLEGKRFIGMVHVHPRAAAREVGGAETFGAADLTGFLRSDYPGFLDLLVTSEGATALVRTRRFLYIAADRVDRDPLLLERDHPGLRAPATPDPRAAEKAAADARAALRAICHLYELALYRGSLEAPLELEYRPR